MGGSSGAFLSCTLQEKLLEGRVQEVLAPLGAVAGTGAKWERGGCEGWQCFLALLGLEVVVYR